MFRTLVIASTAFATPVMAQMAPAPASPAVAIETVDPVKLAEARLVVAKLIPAGTYRTVMNSSMSVVTDGMAAGLKAMPLKQIARMGGLTATQAQALDRIDVEKVMAIYDPHWQERTRLTMRAMFEAMGDFFTTLEPELREAYARAYADRFTLAELRDIDAFLATPSGSKFAARYLTMASDPAIAAEMRTIMPKMMEQMPAFLAAAQKATASLPPPRKLQNLSAADKAALAKALGVPESDLKDPKGAP